MLFIWKYPNKSYNFDAKLKTRNYYEKDLFLHTFANKKQMFASIRQMPSNISIISLKKTISRRFWWGKTIVYLPSVIRYTTHT